MMMQRTSIAALVLTGAFAAGMSAIATWRFFGLIVEIPVAVSITLWGMALVCGLLAWRVRGKKENHGIGQDRSQMSPVHVAQCMVIGKASAWTGAVVGGSYLGTSAYLGVHASQLVAAATDLPGALASAIGGVVLAACGVWLERSCQVAPPSEGETIG